MYRPLPVTLDQNEVLVFLDENVVPGVAEIEGPLGADRRQPADPLAQEVAYHDQEAIDS